MSLAPCVPTTVHVSGHLFIIFVNGPENHRSPVPLNLRASLKTIAWLGILPLSLAG
jgi:hypothetical protein